MGAAVPPELILNNVWGHASNADSRCFGFPERVKYTVLRRQSNFQLLGFHMIKSLVCAGCICVLLLQMPNLAGQELGELVAVGQVRDDPEGSVMSPFSKGDSFEKLALHTLFKATMYRELEISSAQQENYLAFGEKLPQWKADEIKRLKRIHGQEFLEVKENRTKDMSELNKAIQKRWYKEIKESVLLPFQVEKLEAYCAAEIRNKIGDEGLLSTRWALDELGIDDEQLERLEARAKKEQEKLEVDIKELEEQIAELRAKAKENILSELTHKQREKLDKWFQIGSDSDKKK